MNTQYNIKLKKLFLKLVTSYLVTLIIQSTILLIGYHTYKESLGKTLFYSIEKNLITHDYRETISSLDRNIPSFFTSVIYKNADGKVIFSLPQQITESSDYIKVKLKYTTLDSSILLFEYSLDTIISYQILISLSTILIFYLFYIKSKKELTENIENEIISNKKALQNQIAQQFAHDIRSPISTLNLISSKIDNLEIKNIQLSVVKQINTIANNLLDHTKANTDQNYANGPNYSDHAELFIMLSNLKKEYQFKSIIIKQNIIFKFDEKILRGFNFNSELIKVIYPILNNLIQNSLDATSEQNTISIFNSLERNRLQLIVEDNGKGIPPEILDQIGSKPLSFGKTVNTSELIQSGNGVALYNAKKDLNRLGADLKLESKVGIGTKIIIIFP